MTDTQQEILSVPRVVAASVKNYKDIPEELFDSLPESSVDPGPEETPKDEGNSEWRNMLEGRRALMLPDCPDNEDLLASTADQLPPRHSNFKRPRGNEDSANSQRNIRDTSTSRPGVGTKPQSNGLPRPNPGSRITLCSPEGASKEYLIQLERDLQAAGVYFRLPGPPSSPPPTSAVSSSVVNTPRESSAHQREVSVALATLDASLEGFSSNGSSESTSPNWSRASSVAEPPQFGERNRRENVAAGADGVRVCGRSPGAQMKSTTISLDSLGGGIISSYFGHSVSSAVSKEVSPTCKVRQLAGNKTVIQVGEINHEMPEKVIKTKREGKSEATVECLNLIEEVYVTSKTKEIPESGVRMNAFYPTKEFTMRPTSPQVHLVVDSDSGHESGATSPCGTLTGEETSSPPPSPSTSKQPVPDHPPQPPLDQTVRRVEGPSSPIPPEVIKTIPSVLTPERSATDRGDPGTPLRGCGAAVVSQETSNEARNDTMEDEPSLHFVVVAIDFGTTYSGYAFSFTQDPENIHMMKKWEGGDPGIQNQKTPTIVLLTPDAQFHALGFAARDTFHDLDPKEAQRWLYFDRFKMELHSNQSLTRDTLLTAKNGKKVPALTIFSHALRYFRDHAIRELSEQTGIEVEEEDIRWVITVPAIWSHPAKQFMRMAAYQAGMGSPSKQDRLLISLEPEAAAIYCRRLRQNQLLQDRSLESKSKRYSTTPNSTLRSLKGELADDTLSLPDMDREDFLSISTLRTHEKVCDWLREGTIYMVVDCGGGTVDITVHQMTDQKSGHLKELHKATGGPYGSIGVDKEFEELLNLIFGEEFMDLFKKQRSAAYVDLMIAFESRKRNASPHKSTPLNIALPFSFIDLYKRTCKKEVESAIKRHSHLGIKWSSQGMLRIEQETMKRLFAPTLEKISQAIRAVLLTPEVKDIQYMFLVGGFSESELLQKHIRDTFGGDVNVIIPQGMGLAILRGAVQFGLDPSVVTVRRSRLTYGVGVLNRFDPGIHPQDKKVVAAGSEWCADILDKFVVVDESIAIGDVVTRSYTPATPTQKSVILHLYATPLQDVKYVTDPSVQRVGTLSLELGEQPPSASPNTPRGDFVPPSEENSNLDTSSQKREITVHLKFGGTEVKASAVDHFTGQCVKANIEFLAT